EQRRLRTCQCPALELAGTPRHAGHALSRMMSAQACASIRVRSSLLAAFAVLAAFVTSTSCTSTPLPDSRPLDSDEDECAIVQTRRNLVFGGPLPAVGDAEDSPELLAFANTGKRLLETSLDAARQEVAAREARIKARQEEIRVQQENAELPARNALLHLALATSHARRGRDSSFPSDAGNGNSTAVNSNRTAHAGFFIVDIGIEFAHFLREKIAVAMASVKSSLARVRPQVWAMITAFAGSLILATMLCHAAQRHGLVGSMGEPPKSSYVSWKQRRGKKASSAAGLEAEVEDTLVGGAQDVKETLEIIPEIIMCIAECLQFCTTCWCSLSRQTVKWILATMLVFGVGIYFLWQNGVVQPVLQYLAVYLYIFVFIVAVAIIALMEIWQRVRPHVTGPMNAIESVHSKVQNFERRFGLSSEEEGGRKHAGARPGFFG
ncbi:unnamed protein product, partial [Polarella glacialis]